MKLLAYRKKRKLTLSQVCRRLEIDPANLSRIERGEQNPSMDVARRIAKFYGATLDELFGKPIKAA